jgi:hypothetical protein
VRLVVLRMTMREILETIGILLLCVPLFLLAAAIIVPFLGVILGAMAILSIGAAVAMPIAALMGKPMKITVTKKGSDAE